MERIRTNFDASGFVVSGLENYVKNNEDLILKNFALVGTATRKRIGLQTGIKKSADLNYLEVSPTMQSGAGCGFSAAGAVTLTKKTITVATIKVDLDICPKTLLGKWPEYLVRVAANAEELPFEQYIIDGLTNDLNKKIEKLIWQGDHTQSADATIKWIDGFIYQFDNDAAVVDESIANGTNAYNAIKAVYMKMTDEALERGGVIFVSPARYREFLQLLVEKNYYHYAGPLEAAPEEVFFPGTDVKVIKTPGLAGVENKIVGTYAENLVYGTDMENDEEAFDIWYSKDDRVFKFQACWNSGVAYYFGDQVVLGTIAAL